MAYKSLYIEDGQVLNKAFSSYEYHGRLIVRLSSIMFSISFCYFILNLAYDLNAPWFIFASLGASGAVIYTLTKLNKQNAAKLFGLVSFNSIIYAVASSESHLTNINLYFATAGIAALVLFGYREKIKSFLFVTFSFVCYLIARLSDFSPLPYRTFTDDQTTVISFVNLIVFVYVTTYLIILLLKSNKEQSKNLELQNQELTKINKELDQFIYSSSHDLRAPLSSLLGLIQLSELEKDESLRLDYLKMMQDRIKSMDLFIREIVDYARNARLDVQIEAVMIKDQVQKVVSELKYMNGADKISVSLVGMDDIVITTDAIRLQIILTNLISNAIKYREATRAESTLVITAAISASTITLEFKDNGIGISSAQLDKVFTMFYRAHEISTGSGLGLYLVREALNNLNGNIIIDSKEGQGSTFTLTLPNGLPPDQNL